MSKSLDRLTLLETFIRIADSGSISAAARDLDLSQPSVSRQLVDLETRLQTQLVRRNTHGLALTEDGYSLLADARQLTSAWDVIEEKFVSATKNIKGTLKVVAPVALGQSHLTRFASEFLLAYPQVNLHWQLEDAQIKFTEVGCDCWIKIGPVNDDRLIVRPIGGVHRRLLASPKLIGDATYDHPEQLKALPMIALQPFEGGSIPLTHKDGRSVEFTGKAALTTNNILSVKESILLGAGIAVLPQWFVEDELRSGTLVNVLPNWSAPTLTIHLAFLPNRHQPRRLSVFLDLLQKHILSINGINPV